MAMRAMTRRSVRPIGATLAVMFMTIAFALPASAATGTKPKVTIGNVKVSNGRPAQGSDLAVASEAAQFALPGVNIGIFCSTPAVGVVRNIGRKRAMEMLLTGRLFDARTALDWGLVNRVVPEAELDAAVKSYTDVIVARSPAAVRLGKASFYAQVDRPLATAYDVASETMACNMLLDDAAEGIDAFLEKRAAAWSGR